MAGNHFIERAVTDEVIYELMGLSGQEYVDIYAASVKDGRNAGGAGANPNSTDAARIPRQPLASQLAVGAGVSPRVSERCGVILAVTVSPATTMTASAHHT